VVNPVTEENPETAESSANLATSSVKEGDVTESLASDMTALERKQLVQTLNKQAGDDRASCMQGEITKQASRSFATFNEAPIIALVHGSGAV